MICKIKKTKQLCNLYRHKMPNYIITLTIPRKGDSSSI